MNDHDPKSTPHGAPICPYRVTVTDTPAEDVRAAIATVQKAYRAAGVQPAPAWNPPKTRPVSADRPTAVVHDLAAWRRNRT